MNSYSPNLAVNTLLSLDTAAEPRKDTTRSSAPDDQDSFGRILSEQDRPEVAKPRREPERQDKPSDSRDSQTQKPADQEHSATRADSPKPDDAPQAERQTVADNDADRAPEDDTQEQSQPQSADSDEPVSSETQESGTEDLVVDLALVAESEESSSVPAEGEASVIDSEADPSSEVLEADKTMAEEVVAVTATQAPLARAETIKADALSPLSQQSVPDELKPYRVNAAGKPLNLVASEEGQLNQSGESAFVELALKGGKKESSAAIQPETKSAAVRQLSQLANQLGGQPVVSTEQALKELAARSEMPAVRANTTAISALAAAVSRGTSQSQPASVLTNTNPANALQAQVKAGIGQPKWQAVISERVAFMASQNIKSAEIQLDPPELGPLQVRVTVNQDQASVAFASHHAQVREALDQTAFRLRDMLQQEGMTQVDVDVSGEAFSQESGEGGSNGNSGAGQSDFDAEEAQEVTVTARVSNSLVDHFV
ncbi:MAG: flagellar hook-length control protein FliK [Candidatus Pelagadaptatus aseana]|uniref:flagellar hook-length control protein FliK n=1 Tax=Candidatus Pelagadaptatus aseana TaxID=3120508 RepID=UPI0039B2A3C0